MEFDCIEMRVNNSVIILRIRHEKALSLFERIGLFFIISLYGTEGRNRTGTPEGTGF